MEMPCQEEENVSLINGGIFFEGNDDDTDKCIEDGLMKVDSYASFNTTGYEFASSLMHNSDQETNNPAKRVGLEQDYPPEGSLDLLKKSIAPKKVSKASKKFPEFLSKVANFSESVESFKVNHRHMHSTASRWEYLHALKHKILQSSFDHWGADLGALFDKTDTEKSGYIGVSELSRSVKKLLSDVSMKDLALLEKAAAGSTRRTSLSRKEFIDFISSQHIEVTSDSGSEEEDYRGSPSPKTDTLADIDGKSSPVLKSDRLDRLSTPLERHRYNPPVDRRNSSNHRGRQRPPPQAPLQEMKEKMQKEYSLGYRDSEKELWEKTRAAQLQEVQLAEDYNAGKDKKRVTVRLSDFEEWLQKNKKWTNLVKEKCDKIFNEVTKDKNFVPTRFIPKMSGVLAAKAFERYSKELLLTSNENSSVPVSGTISDSNIASVDVSEDQMHDISRLSIDSNKEITLNSEILKMFEVLPVHERLAYEAILFNKKTQSKLDAMRRPSYSPPKMLAKSKQILDEKSSMRTRRSMNTLGVSREHFDTFSPPPPPPPSTHDSAGGDMGVIRSPTDRGVKQQLEEQRRFLSQYMSSSGATDNIFKFSSSLRGISPITRKGFGASCPRFFSPNRPSESPMLQYLPPPATKVEISKGSAAIMQNRETFEERLNKSIEKHKQRGSTGNSAPGPGHYRLPTDALLSIGDNKASGGSASSMQTSLSRSASPGFSFSRSTRRASSSSVSSFQGKSVAEKLAFASSTSMRKPLSQAVAGSAGRLSHRAIIGGSKNEKEIAQDQWFDVDTVGSP